MWILIGMFAWATTTWIARPFKPAVGGLICTIPVIVWTLAYFGLLGPGADDDTHPQYMFALLGLFLGGLLTQLLQWVQSSRKRKSATETHPSSPHEHP